jgi:hypothetical protein
LYIKLLNQLKGTENYRLYKQIIAHKSGGTRNYWLTNEEMAYNSNRAYALIPDRTMTARKERFCSEGTNKNVHTAWLICELVMKRRLLITNF